MKAFTTMFVIANIVAITCFAMQSPSGSVDQLIARAQTMADASKSDMDYSKQDNDKIIAALQELQQLLTAPATDAIKFSLTKQYEVITLVVLQGKRLARMMSQGEEIALYKQQISKQGTPEQSAQVNNLYNNIQTNTVIFAGDIEKNLLVVQQMIVLVIDILQQQPSKLLTAPLLEAEKNIGLLLSQKNIGHAQHAAFLAVQIGELFVDPTADPKSSLEKARELTDQTSKLLPPPPAVTDVAKDHEIRQREPFSDVSIPQPTKPSTPFTVAPGKAGENIQKANNKISSAIRRIETVKKYYPEMDREEKTAIKKKAVGILKEYESGVAGFTQKIQQVKHEAGNQLDETKLAPFSTFLDLVNKLYNSINGL